jgi:hypothetical protein
MIISINALWDFVFTAVKIRVEVFWVLTQCCGRISKFRRSILPQSWGWSQEAKSSEIFWYTTTTLHGLTTQKTSTWTPRIPCTLGMYVQVWYAEDGSEGDHLRDVSVYIRKLCFINCIIVKYPVWWPGNKNSPTVTHACRKRRLKWVPGAWG